MTVYVCYEDHAYDGCSPPMAVFETEEEAEAWVKEGGCGAYEEFD